jgi:nucleotide-binding universal stress UspA family protein
MKRVIIPTDFSFRTPKIIEAGVRLAQQMNVAVEIIHVIDSFEYGVNFVINESSPIILPPDVLNDQVGKAQEKFQEIIADLKMQKSVLPEIFMSVKTGFVFDVIAEQLHDPDVIMVLLNDKSQADYNYRDVSLNLSEIINQSNSPVCVIPNNAPFKDPKNIIYAFNYHEQDLDNIFDLIQIADLVKANIHILHIVAEKSLKDKLAMVGLEKKIQEHTNTDNIIFKIIESKDIVKTIDDYAHVVEADMISILRANKTLFQGIFSSSKTKNIIYKTNLPVLVYQEHKSNA